MQEDEKIPFTSHLEELRKRLIVCFVTVGVCFAVSYAFKEKLFEILVHPLISVMKPGDTLVFTGLPEAFFTYLQVSLLAGILLASPVILYQIWMFVVPGLYTHEKKIMQPALFLTMFFFLAGALFGYFFVFPLGFKFFLGFATDIIKPLPSMKEYLSLASKMLLAFGFAFELPMVLTFMARLGLVSVGFLKKNRKYAVLIAFIVGAILTPPDVVSQIMMAVPLCGLYELGILGARVFAKKQKTEESPQ